MPKTSSKLSFFIFRKVSCSAVSSHSQSIKAAIKYLHEAQTPEGGWIGSWGICMTYAMQFALESLSLVGETCETSASVRRACEFILSHQRDDGGFGESYKVSYLLFLYRCCLDSLGQSCEQSRWVEHENTQVVQTCWAIMALMYAKYPYPGPIEKAVRLVMSRQRPVSTSSLIPKRKGTYDDGRQDGSWPQEAIEGVFNKTCAIAYPNFKFSFPIWMLGKAHWYLKELKSESDGRNGSANGNGHAHVNGNGNGV